MSRIVTSGEDWMRDVEKSLRRQERRPAPPSFADQLGPGITQRARAIVDWNDPANLRNGWFFSDVLSLNTPDPMVAWSGMTVISSDNRGVQHLWSHEERSRQYVRTFSFGVSPVPVFTDYRVVLEDTGWITAILGNGWTHFDSQRLVQYRRLNGIVHWRGLAKNGTVGAVICAVPTGFRPEARLSSDFHIPVSSNNGIGQMQVDAALGQVLLGVGSNVWVDFKPLFWTADR